MRYEVLETLDITRSLFSQMEGEVGEPEVVKAVVKGEDGKLKSIYIERDGPPVPGKGSVVETEKRVVKSGDMEVVRGCPHVANEEMIRNMLAQKRAGERE
jgi:hypothetical protein